MYIRVTPGAGDPSRADEASRWGNETLIPALRRMTGFRGYYGGVDRQTGNITAISLWDTEQQARGMRDEIDPTVLRQIGDLGIRLSESEVFEVTVQA